MPVEAAVEVADGDVARGQDRPIVTDADADARRVVLVGDVADDLLEDILKRHDSLDVAELVHHEGEVLVTLAERLKLVEEFGGFRHEPRRRRQRYRIDAGTIAARLAERLEERLHVQDADDVLALPPPQWHARVRL